MVPTAVASRPGARARRGLADQLLTAYTSGWSVLLIIATFCALVPAARWLAHHELALALHLQIRPAPAPSVGAAAGLLVNNLRATGWPLLAVLLGAQRLTWLRRLVHGAVVVSLTANLLPIGAAIGVYRSQIVPFLPHLPFELYAITTGPAIWLISTRRPVSRRQLTIVSLTILVALAGAALLETWAVPHR
jgi:hypothetical protein